MAYAIERSETLHGALLRITGEQIVRARDALTDQNLPLDERIHDARKRFKEIRALLRLFREPLAGQFAPENRWFRDAGRDLSAARDATAVVEALESLHLPAATFRSASTVLASHESNAPPIEPIIANVVEQLVVAQARPALWPSVPDAFEAIAPGLGRTYAGGRTGLRSHATPEQLHEWRKRVKDLWYHTQLLREVWPEVMKANAEVLSSLSRALGSHHDLHVLRERLSVAGDCAWFRKTGQAIERRQHELESQARAIAERVYAEKRREWLARMRKYWTAWERTGSSSHLPDA